MTSHRLCRSDGRLVRFRRVSAEERRGGNLRFDAIHAVTSPYTTEILERRLGAPPSAINTIPSAYFGGGHPNPICAKALCDRMLGPDAPDFGTTSGRDGDRNMILARGIYITPYDGLAALTANAHLVPGCRSGVAGGLRAIADSSRVGSRGAKTEARRRPAGNSLATCWTRKKICPK
ncbi:hypothetical protein MN186_11045 [Aliiroseovarius sp. N1F302]|nr:hypothetical protein [Aliiroseovarius sediminis]MCI2394995.1 hypothetical protein [Aliiroseovarius sediminis]